MRSGSLRQKLKIEHRTRVEDGGGGFVQGWETYKDNLSGRVKQLGGTEAVVGDKLAGVSTHEIYLRFSSKTKDISNLMRVVEKRTGVIHDIKNVNPDERDRWIVLTTQTGKRNG